MANSKIMKDSWKGKGTAAPVAHALNKGARVVNEMRMEDGGNIQKFGDQIVLPGTVIISRKTSFCYKKRVTNTIHIGTGRISWSGRGTFTLLENDVANVIVIQGGTALAPYFLSIRVSSANGPHDAVLWCTATYPEDGGGFLFYPLYEVWLNSAGSAVCGNDIRFDLRLRSPI
jgi:hypothetical protein